MRSSGTDNFTMLVIGYGNTLRCDDGVGPAVVARLARKFRGDPRIAFMTPHQLFPEIAADLDVDRVIFIDATISLPAGEVRVSRVRAAAGGHAGMTHHVSVSYLLSLAEAIHGRVPRAISIAVGVGDLSMGERLSPPVEEAARALVQRLSRQLRRPRVGLAAKRNLEFASMH